MENINVNDVFVAVWGYDQTNADFYQVVGMTAKSVKIRHIKKTITKDDNGFMTGNATPLINEFDGEVITRRIYLFMNKERFNAGDSRGSAEKWNGKNISISWYA